MAAANNGNMLNYFTAHVLPFVLEMKLIDQIRMEKYVSWACALVASRPTLALRIAVLRPSRLWLRLGCRSPHDFNNEKHERQSASPSP
eukprot:scaffold9957_cov19-Prasinocladus_malaysianus.AAC.1